GLLARVGLEGFAERETATLSGGELQRLALAAALARRPALLLSDETTAMIDRGGRQQVVDLLASVAADGTAVVHVTHRAEEAARADRRFALEAGTLVETAAPAAPPPPRLDAHPVPTERPVLVELSGVGHTYGTGTPWQHRALAGIDLRLQRGDGLLIVGRNGSGKSTLAWILAGLLEPSEGTACLRGRALHTTPGAVALSFQHARLQLLRATVRDDVQAASGVDGAAADVALVQVGLDPAVFGDRRVDELSGGQQRRVALAGLLAAEPEVLVLDEPFAGLDTAGRQGLAALLADLRTARSLTLVIVSHDTEGLDGVVDRTLELDRGMIAGTCVDPTPPPARRRRRELHLFRVVPRDTPIHRLWAGTKLVGLVAVAVALSIQPGWPSIGVAAGLLAAGVLLARIPRGAAPHLPRWFWIGMAISAALALEAGGHPVVHVAGARIGVGALGEWARATSLAAVLLLSAALVSWTTALASVAPALRRLGAPAARLGLPVDEWTTAVALGIRCLPLLVDETRTLAAVRRLRLPHRPTGARHRIQEPLDLLTAELTVALRRAGELASAVEARGGLGAIADDPARPGWRDAVALALIAAVVVAVIVL
ncbi:MAG TPA: ATP-binding cassette domain-containing protein, partial [Acidimicrobiia bacterium]|nr:ATP-binding cassette domain-containing protein [Acidimicrobiia bacterium]